MLQDIETENAESMLQEEEMEHGQMVKKQDAKRKKIKEFRSFRTSKRRTNKKTKKR